MKEEYIKLILPLPISINKAYAWYRKRHKSDDYKVWYYEAFAKLKEQTEYIIKWDAWLFVEYNFYTNIYTSKWKRIVDVANFEKVLSDFLADNLIWFKDHKIKRMLLEKHNSQTNYVEIKIKEI